MIETPTQPAVPEVGTHWRHATRLPRPLHSIEPGETYRVKSIGPMAGLICLGTDDETNAMNVTAEELAECFESADVATQVGPTLFEATDPPPYQPTAEQAARWGDDLMRLKGRTFALEKGLAKIVDVSFNVQGAVRAVYSSDDTRETIKLGRFFEMIEGSAPMSDPATSGTVSLGEMLREGGVPEHVIEEMTAPVVETQATKGMGFGGMDEMIRRQDERFEARQVELTGHRSDECPQYDHADCVQLAEEHAQEQPKKRGRPRKVLEPVNDAPAPEKRTNVGPGPETRRERLERLAQTYELLECEAARIRRQQAEVQAAIADDLRAIREERAAEDELLARLGVAS